MGNALAPSRTEGAHEGERCRVDAVSKLLALDGIVPIAGEPCGQSGGGPSSSRIDNDVLSKSTESTTGSPDLSVQGRSRLQQRSAGSGALATALGHSGHHLRPSASVGVPDAPSSSSSHCSKSPFSRLFRRKHQGGDCGEATQAPRAARTPFVHPSHASQGTHRRQHQHPPSCVIVEQEEQPLAVLVARPGNPPPLPAGGAGETTSSTIPVRPSRGHPDYDEEEQESAHLQQLYDLRTWDMYLRITEARKRQRKASASASAAIPSHAPQNAEPSSSSGRHEDLYSYSDGSNNVDPDHDSSYGWFDDGVSVSPNTAVYPSPGGSTVALYNQQQLQHYYMAATPAAHPSRALVPAASPLPLATSAAEAGTSGHELIFGDLEL